MQVYVSNCTCFIFIYLFFTSMHLPTYCLPHYVPAFLPSFPLTLALLCYLSASLDVIFTSAPVAFLLYFWALTYYLPLYLLTILPSFPLTLAPTCYTCCLLNYRLLVYVGTCRFSSLLITYLPTCLHTYSLSLTITLALTCHLSVLNIACEFAFFFSLPLSS